MSDQEIFKNIAAAQRYLQQRGHKIKKSKLYADSRQGLIRVQDNGSVLLADVLDYSRSLGPCQTPAELRLKAALGELRRLRSLFDITEELIIEKLNHGGEL